MYSRREFLKSAATAGAFASVPVHALASRYQVSSGFFGLNSFVENHPEAVFIMRTNVSDYMNGDEKKQAGLVFGRSLIIPKENGVALTSLIPIKPNIRMEFDWIYNEQARKPAASRVPGYKGTDPYFTEGIIESMKELGLSGRQFYIREVNGNNTGSGTYYYPEMAQRTGAELRYMGEKVGVISENDLVWVDTPEGIWYRKIPYLWPINAPDTWLLNIGKFKAHSMGLTLCAKNLQGSIAKNYQAHCTAYNAKMDMASSHINPNALTVIKDNCARHLADGVPRWDRTGDSTWNSGIGMETWASRCIDNNRYLPTGINIIEGIYGVDGHFRQGPNPAGNENNAKGESWEYLTNYIIFGRNSFHVDIIGHWLGCHEAGNLGLFHMALEQGMSSYLNPLSIPVYEWKADGSAVMTPLTSFAQTPLLTYYMQRNYNGQTENYWHLLNEPFDYTSVAVEKKKAEDRPRVFVLHQNMPNPFNPATSIEFSIPSEGHARLEVFNSAGQLLDVLVDSRLSQGSHMAVWNTTGRSSGVYFYRFRFGGFSETKKMTLVR